MIKIGIIKESRSDDKRTPLTPNNVKDLLTSFSNINFFSSTFIHRRKKRDPGSKTKY